MKLKEAVIESCPKCGGYIKEVKPEQYGCDFCKKRIKVSRHTVEASDSHLRATIFYKKSEKRAEDVIFCSWKCCFAYLRKLDKKGLDFIGLPYLTFDRKQDPGDFFKRIK